MRRLLAPTLVTLAFLHPLIVGATAPPDADRTLSVAVEVDRSGARLLGYTLKSRPFRPDPEPAAPRAYREGLPLQVEVALRGPGGAVRPRRVDAGPICLEHGPEAPPHVRGDTIVVHRDSFLVELPELAGFDRIDVALYESGRTGLVRRVLGSDHLDAARFLPAGGPASYRDLAFANPGDGDEGATTLDTSGVVSWPEDSGDTELYRIYGDAAEGDRRINVVIVPDGYTHAEKGVMESHADSMVQHFRQKTPFLEHDVFINYTLVYAYSEQSGTDQCDCGIIVDTAMGTRFPNAGNPCGHSGNRCLYYGAGCDTDGTANIIAAELRAPYHDETIVMVNTTRYGGCGGSRAVYSAGNSAATEVAVHELGHSLGGLADEYGGDPSCGTWASEINTSLIPGKGAWPEWVPEIGEAREGGQYYDQCIYRPVDNCEMRSLNQPFCPVCNQHWSLVVYGHPRVGPTAPIAGTAPDPLASAFVSIPKTFSVATRLASGPGITHDVVWTVQGPTDPEPLTVATGVTTLEHTFSEEGQHVLSCRVTADTNFVKPAKNGANVDEATWVVEVAALIPPPEISDPENDWPLLFTDATTLVWEDARDRAVLSYNLYRGALPGLAGGDYGICIRSGLETPGTQEADEPPDGVCWTYLVSGVNPLGEGPLGQDSSGGSRLPGASCD